jgi:hypothetical protein
MKEFKGYMDIPQDVIEELLAPGYGPMEFGDTMLEDGTVYSSTYARFSYAKGYMIDWWFSTYLKNTNHYQFWSPDHGTFEWDKNKKNGTTIGGTHISYETFGTETIPMAITFYDFRDLVDEEKVKAANISCFLIGEVRLQANNQLLSCFVHVGRDTYYGCELRNRFWAPGDTREHARAMNIHNIEEMGSLAEFLPGLYLRENK